MEKIEWYGYPTVKKNLKICLFVLTEYTNVTDRQTSHDGIGRAYAQHRAAKTTKEFADTIWRIRISVKRAWRA